jgi:molybdopterin converting factor small subunit
LIQIAQVKIRFLSTFQTISGAETIDLIIPKEATLDTVLSLLEKRFGDQFTKHVRNHLDYVTIYINNKSYLHLEGLKTRINDGNKITLGHVIAGG